MNVRSVVLALLALSPCTAVSSEGQPSASSDLRIMTFNIRYGTADDGPNAWPFRKQMVFDVIRSSGAQIVGLQEALAFQLDEIQAVLDGYRRIGVGRDDGQNAGEYAAILVDTTLLTVMDEGTFWFSETPEVPGSMTWGNRIPRICTWVRVRDPAATRTFVVFNVHWDHESQESREKSAGLMLDSFLHLTDVGDGVIVMGDFNAGEKNPAFRMLLEAPQVPLKDTFRALHPKATGVGTFNAFKGETTGEKIDAILVSEHWGVGASEIPRFHRKGRYPSDHFPVTATIQYRGSGR